MLQRAVALLLQRLLGKFVSFDASMLRLALWQGDVSFRDLQLRLAYGEGAIGHLSVNIPWRALWTQPVVLKASGVRVSLHRTPPAESGDPPGAAVPTGDDDDGGGTAIDAADVGDGAPSSCFLHCSVAGRGLTRRDL